MCVIKPAYSVSFLLSINIFVWQNVLYFLDAPHSFRYFNLCWFEFDVKHIWLHTACKLEVGFEFTQFWKQKLLQGRNGSTFFPDLPNRKQKERSIFADTQEETVNTSQIPINLWCVWKSIYRNVLHNSKYKHVWIPVCFKVQ